MAAIELSDIDYSDKKKKGIKVKKKKSSIKPKTTVKKAKVVSSAKIRVKKKKSESFKDVPIALDPTVLYAEAAEEGKRITDKREKAAKRATKAKEKLEEQKPKKKKKNLPAVMDTGEMQTQVSEILDALPDVVKQENQQLDEYIHMFNTLQTVARIAEEKYVDTKQSRDIYPLMQVYNQMRELIADLRALRDVGQLGEVMNSEVLSPFANMSASIMIKLVQDAKAWSKSHSSDLSFIQNFSDAVDNLLRKSAKDMEQSYHASLQKTVEVFG